jgi:homoserine kinase
MCRSDPELVGSGMQDSVVTPKRAALITGYDDAVDAARGAGAHGVTVSGSGPGVLAVCAAEDRRDVASAMVGAFESHGANARAYRTEVGQGAELI